MTKILITNGEFKNTLAAVRALGHDYDVTVTRKSWYPVLSSVSKYCRRSVRIRFSDADEAYSELIAYLKSEKYDLLIPTGLDFCELVSMHYEEIRSIVPVMAPSYESFVIASQKKKTMDFAEKNGVPVPATCRPDDEDKISSLGYPCVLKSSEGSGEYVYYCKDPEELKNRYASLTESEKKSAICQEYVSGFGCGYFALYDNGIMLAEYMHKRLREYPVSGGPSVEAETFYDEKLRNYGRILCKALNWTGPIMCEFKYSPEHDDYKLIEINPKLWGSLDLTIASGVNIPKIIADYMQNGTSAKSLYPESIYKKYKWVLPGEVQYYIGTFPKTKLRSIFKSGHDEETNIVLSDPLPVIYEAAITFAKIILRSGR